MRLRPRRFFHTPEVMIIPMIDIMFFLLVFFMMGTLYMVQVKTVDVNLPQTAHSDTQLSVSYVVTIKKMDLYGSKINSSIKIRLSSKRHSNNSGILIFLSLSVPMKALSMVRSWFFSTNVKAPALRALVLPGKWEIYHE